MRTKATLAELERLRMIAADRLDEGKKPAQIAAFLGVKAQSVREWRRDYLAGGRAALASAKPTGRPRKLSDAQRQELAAVLAQGPAAHGYEAHLWTTKLIARLIKERFGVEHHHDHVGVILHELGISPQVPARRAKERDEARIIQWRDTLWPALLKKCRGKRRDRRGRRGGVPDEPVSEGDLGAGRANAGGAVPQPPP
jgi:putative transposase